jgi:hypothetical protein
MTDGELRVRSLPGTTGSVSLVFGSSIDSNSGGSTTRPQNVFDRQRRDRPRLPIVDHSLHFDMRASLQLQCPLLGLEE